MVLRATWTIAVWEGMDMVGAAVEEALETGAHTVAVHPIAASETGGIVGLRATLAVDRVPTAAGGIVVIDTIVGVTTPIGGGMTMMMIERGTTMTGAGVPLVDIGARAGAVPDNVTLPCHRTAVGSTARLGTFLTSPREGGVSAGAEVP